MSIHVLITQKHGQCSDWSVTHRSHLLTKALLALSPSLCALRWALWVFYQVQSTAARLSSGLKLLILTLRRAIFPGPVGLSCYRLSDKLSPAIFICRLMEVLRKLVGTIRLLPLPYLLLRSQPFLPLLGKAAQHLLLAVTALTLLIHLLKPPFLPLTFSVLRQVA